MKLLRPACSGCIISHRLGVILLVLFSLLFVIQGQPLHADVGIIVYESKGVDARRTSTGHLALIATSLCAEGIDQVRSCKAGEVQGVAITRYMGMAFGHDDWFVFVLPLRDYFTATDNASQAPVLSSGNSLESMQIEYWRNHLRPYLPPMTHDQYVNLKSQLESFSAKKTLGQAVTMELLVHLLMPQKKKYPTEPIALIDPSNGELIPNGRWREAIGAAYTRSSIVITAPASLEQEEQLIPFIQGIKHQPFQTMSSNCSDFSKSALLQVFGNSGLHFHPRVENIADAFISSPLEVTTEFLHFAKRYQIPLSVQPIPMLAGTRYPTTEITSVTRGALVPNPQQGQLAFGLKIFINWLNPFIGLTAISLDRLSRPANLRELIHQHGGGNLSQLAAEMAASKNPSKELINSLHREQVRVFGTTSCWKSKSDQFLILTRQAQELALLTKAEQSLLLKPDRPYLLPRLYEETAAVKGQDGTVMAGLPNLTDSLGAQSASASVPDRSAILDMANSDLASSTIRAFKLMTAVINYDLSSEADHRRPSDQFDLDWNLFQDVARKNGLHVPTTEAFQKSVQTCSCGQFERDNATRDAFGDAQRWPHELARQTRVLIYGPSR